ncbi:MAG: LacI family DNA-binding transcriptional regulator [Actinomycetales bacterium]
MSGRAKRGPAMRDVAQLAGVSTSLVSLVMRGEPMVSPERRRRVLEAAAELGYRTPPSARASAGQRRPIVAVMVADLANRLLTDVAQAAERSLRAAGLTPLITSPVATSPAGVEDTLDEEVVAALKDLQIVGCISVGSVPDLDGLQRLLGPLPLVVAAAHAGELAADEVRSDDRLGLRLVVDFLVARGHRAIAHLGGRGGPVAQARLDGYVEAMGVHGLSDLTQVAEAEFTEDSGYRGTAGLLRQHREATAIAALNDLAALGALAAVSDAGLSVPTDIAVTGYDDTFVAALPTVSLTTINQNATEIGDLAAGFLTRRMADPAREYERSLLVPRLVTRSSAQRLTGNRQPSGLTS